MTEDRALEIIAVFGAAAARWPAADRDAVLALADRPAVAIALADAARFDALLADWAQGEVVVRPFDLVRLPPASTSSPPQRAASRYRRGWLVGGLLAAAVAAAAVLTPMERLSPGAIPQMAQNSLQSPVSSATASDEVGDDAGFAYVFTPTVDEDALI